MSITFDRRSVAVLVAAILAGGSLFVVSQRSAEAQNQPANKVSAAGSTVEVAGPGETIPVLSETIKVSTPADLILQLTAECDILTELFTGGEGLSADFAEAFGQVVMHIEIDGKRVPVSSNDIEDVGEVVFCNRAHSKSIRDAEENDGIDEEDEMTRTRQANGFNWLALNTGFDYDDFAVANGKNILEIVVYATFTTEGTVLDDEDETVKGRAEALVGNRTLIVEPTKVANSETVTEADLGEGTEEPETEPSSKGKRP